MKKTKIISLVLVSGIAVFLYYVFKGSFILPQTISIGPIVIRYYGIIISVAVLSSWRLARKNAENYQLTKNQADDIIFWTIVMGFVGARLYHVASSFSYYLQNPIDILKVWNGGLSIYGAILGGLIAAFILKKLFTIHYSPLTVLDWLTPAVLLGQIIGRFGNLFNYELYGYPTNLPWKMFVPENFRSGVFVDNAFFHPLFLYEALWNLFLFFLLTSLKRKQANLPLFFVYLLLYNAFRIFIEILKIDPVYIGPFKQNILVSLTLVLFSLFGIFFQKKHAKIS